MLTELVEGSSLFDMMFSSSTETVVRRRFWSGERVAGDTALFLPLSDDMTVEGRSTVEEDGKDGLEAQF